MSPDPIWPQILLQVILILLNAFFASTEIAVLSLNDNLLRLPAEEVPIAGEDPSLCGGERGAGENQDALPKNLRPYGVGRQRHFTHLNAAL